MNTEFKPGDRVFVTDPALAQIRAIMRGATGQEPKPNHHGTVEEVWGDGSVLIYFDDGVGAPYPVAEVRPLTDGIERAAPMTATTDLRAKLAAIERLADSIHGDSGWAHNSGCEGEPDCLACIELDLRAILTAAHPDPADDRVDLDAVRREAWGDGVRQAMTWLQADYPAFDGPEWRERGVEWIADRLRNHRADAVAQPDGSDGR
jgi:hypothetical protein